MEARAFEQSRAAAVPLARPSGPGLSPVQRFCKRGFDLAGATIGLLLAALPIALCWLLAAADTRGSGFFLQKRVGRGGRLFSIVKIRTMRPPAGGPGVAAAEPRVTALGRILRRFKLDELPQLWNVLLGHMSLVGPRPEVPGYADRLEGRSRAVLSVRPGITGPASLAFRNEQELLARQADPARFKREVLYPEKVRLNVRYVENYRFERDLLYLAATLLPWLMPRVVPRSRILAEAA